MSILGNSIYTPYKRNGNLPISADRRFKLLSYIKEPSKNNLMKNTENIFDEINGQQLANAIIRYAQHNHPEISDAEQIVQNECIIACSVCMEYVVDESDVNCANACLTSYRNIDKLLREKNSFDCWAHNMSKMLRENM
ncbi:hypothetical protein SNEBB_002109 [Seison nebaliae]|nr:hypothetical protein SNEBB_002109 [Seison nebaliae]